MAANGDSSRREESGDAGGASPLIGLNGGSELSAAASPSKRESDRNQVLQAARELQPAAQVVSKGSQVSLLMGSVPELLESTAQYFYGKVIRSALRTDDSTATRAFQRAISLFSGAAADAARRACFWRVATFRSRGIEQSRSLQNIQVCT